MTPIGREATLAVTRYQKHVDIGRDRCTIVAAARRSRESERLRNFERLR